MCTGPELRHSLDQRQQRHVFLALDEHRHRQPMVGHGGGCDLLGVGLLEVRVHQQRQQPLPGLSALVDLRRQGKRWETAVKTRARARLRTPRGGDPYRPRDLRHVCERPTPTAVRFGDVEKVRGIPRWRKKLHGGPPQKRAWDLRFPLQLTPTWYLVTSSVNHCHYAPDRPGPSPCRSTLPAPPPGLFEVEEEYRRESLANTRSDSSSARRT